MFVCIRARHVSLVFVRAHTDHLISTWYHLNLISGSYQVLQKIWAKSYNFPNFLMKVLSFWDDVKKTSCVPNILMLNVLELKSPIPLWWFRRRRRMCSRNSKSKFTNAMEVNLGPSDKDFLAEFRMTRYNFDFLWGIKSSSSHASGFYGFFVYLFRYVVTHDLPVIK